MNALLVDDHFCAREGISCLLKLIYSEVQVLEADSFEAGMRVVRQIALNLVLLDIQLPDKKGLAGLEVLRREFPSISVVMFSGLDDRDLVFDALKLGAMGFISKAISPQEFIEALRYVMSGRVYLPLSVLGKFCEKPQPIQSQITGMKTVSDPADFGLTPREFEVLGWLVQGKCNKEIARNLNIEEQSVKNHLRPIFQKYSVSKRTELLVKLFEQGIVFGQPGVGNAMG
jgi:DNA-binding NarL/FixJ family response regulator